MTPFWYVIVTLGIIAAIINFSLAFARRAHPMVALIRAAAGLVSLALAAGIVLGKAIDIAHPPLSRENVFIGVGVFIAVVFLVPSYVERGRTDAPKITLQQRAARPVNATVRLRDAATDEWMN